MNKATLKIIRKWSKLRSLGYKVCKHLYEKQSEENKAIMMEEMTKYIDAVEIGLVTPSRPEPRKQPQVIQNDTV